MAVNQSITGSRSTIPSEVPSAPAPPGGYFHPQHPAGQVYPGLADLHALCDAQARELTESRKRKEQPDFRVGPYGSGNILWALTTKSKQWIERNQACLHRKGSSYVAIAIVAESHNLLGLIRAIRDAGLRAEWA